MTSVTFTGGPLNGRLLDCDRSILNVIDDSSGVTRLVSYRIDLEAATGRVVSDEVA